MLRGVQAAAAAGCAVSAAQLYSFPDSSGSDPVQHRHLLGSAILQCFMTAVAAGLCKHERICRQQRQSADTWLAQQVSSRTQHTNGAVGLQDACAAYVIALAALVARPRHAAGAAAAADAWIRENACEEVRGWRRDSTEPGAGPPCDAQIGFVRWAWVHAFRWAALVQGLELVSHLCRPSVGQADVRACKNQRI